MDELHMGYFLHAILCLHNETVSVQCNLAWCNCYLLSEGIEKLEGSWTQDQNLCCIESYYTLVCSTTHCAI